jgi:protein involved in polysaccharide export with SLBB domain
MPPVPTTSVPRLPRRSAIPAGWLGRCRAYGPLMTCLLLGALTGCASITFPSKGIPAIYVPPELLAEPQDGKRTIDLTLLGQPAPAAYRLGPEDVLGVWIDGILGERAAVPVTVHDAPAPEFNLPPGVGVPLQVSPDGTLSLPLLGPLRVSGMTLNEAQIAIQDAYVERRLVKPDTNRVLLSLVRPRTYHVTVIRRDRVIGPNIGNEVSVGGIVKEGMGFVVDLPAYENDVLTAIARTGGLPAEEAVNAIFVQRSARRVVTGAPGGDLLTAGEWITIPLRARPGEPLPFGPDDVILHDGDVVFIEAREEEWIYTGGLLPAGRTLLPRDHDLDVLEAVALAGGPMFSGSVRAEFPFGGSVIERGAGGPSPSLVIILRRTPDGGQVPIRVDLNRAMRDPRERIILVNGDVVLLQQTLDEAVARYLADIFRFEAVWQVFNRGDAAGTVTAIVP